LLWSFIISNIAAELMIKNNCHTCCCCCCPLLGWSSNGV